jgi:phenylacetate-CoA ligase
MNFASKRKFYEQLPLFIKNISGLVPFPLVAGNAYRQTYSQNNYFDNMNRAQLNLFTEKRLGYWLEYTARHVPAYQNLSGYVERLKPFEALKAFPIIEKEDIQKDFESYLARDLSKSQYYKTTTGGTTGNQLNILLQNNSQAIETAFIHRLWSRVGYSYRHKKASFRGVTFNKLDVQAPWQKNPVYNEMQFSPFHLSEINLQKYFAEFRIYRPSYFHGYASAIDVLAEYALRVLEPKDRPKLRAVLLGSEGISINQRERISQAFSSRVYSWYGQSERVVLAGECEFSNAYHVTPDYGYCELIAKNGATVSIDGEQGEIVGTGFNNHVMPLIRYRTGDLATKLPENCKCGRCWDRFNNVEGRWKKDVIFGKNEARISLAALNMHGDFFDNIVRYQYQQDTIGKLIIKILPGPNYTANDAIRIKNAFVSKVEGTLDIKILEVDNIPLTSRGKLNKLVSKLTK